MLFNFLIHVPLELETVFIRSPGSDIDIPGIQITANQTSRNLVLPLLIFSGSLFMFERLLTARCPQIFKAPYPWRLLVSAFANIDLNDAIAGGGTAGLAVAATPYENPLSHRGGH